MNVIVVLPPLSGAESAASLISDESRLFSSEGSACGVNSCSRQDSVQVRPGEVCSPESQNETHKKSPSPASPHAVNALDGASCHSVETSRESQSSHYSLYPDNYLKGIAKLVRFLSEDKEIQNSCPTSSNGENNTNEKVVSSTLAINDTTKTHLKPIDNVAPLPFENSSSWKKNSKIKPPFDGDPVDFPCKDGNNNFPVSSPLHEINTSEWVEFTGKFFSLKGWELPIMAKKDPQNKYVYVCYDSRLAEGKHILTEEEKSMVFSGPQKESSEKTLPIGTQEKLEDAALFPTIPPKEKEISTLPSHSQSIIAQKSFSEERNSNVSHPEQRVPSTSNFSSARNEKKFSPQKNKRNIEHDESRSRRRSGGKGSNHSEREYKSHQENNAYQNSTGWRAPGNSNKNRNNANSRDDQQVNDLSDRPRHPQKQEVSNPETAKEESKPNTADANPNKRKKTAFKFLSSDNCAKDFATLLSSCQLSGNSVNKPENVPSATTAEYRR